MKPALEPPNDECRDLFDRIDAIADVLERDAVESETLRRLPDTTVRALIDSRLLWLKVPRELGGFEVEPANQFLAFERAAYYSAAAAWCWFIYADVAGLLGARLSERGLAEYLASGDVPVSSGGGGLLVGDAEPVEGGFLLSGDWTYGSGIHAAQWVYVIGRRTTSERPAVMGFVIPKAGVTVDDNWQVLGMRGTGSINFSTERLFVPDHMTFVPGTTPARGGRQFRLGTFGYLGHTVAGVAVGIAQRALDEACAMAATKARGYSNPKALALRPVFQAFVGEANLRLGSARAMMLAIGEKLVDDVDRFGHSPTANEIETRAAGSYTIRTAVEVVNEVLRHTGGEAARSGHFIERALRDIHMAGTHGFANDTSIENHGRVLLGATDVDMMS